MLEVNSLSCKLGESIILRNLNFSISPGDFVALLGPNGSGKTTLIRCLLGFYGFSGEVLLFGKNILDYSRREIGKKIAYVPQVVELLPPYSVENFVQMGLYAYQGFASPIKAEQRSLITKVMQDTEVLHLSQRFVNSLSGGEMRRVMLASALAQNPEILLLDEPEAWLDFDHRNYLVKILTRLNKEEGKTILLASHDVNRLACLGKIFFVLKSGELKFLGSAKELMEKTVLESIYGSDFCLINHPSRNLKMILPK